MKHATLLALGVLSFALANAQTSAPQPALPPVPAPAANAPTPIAALAPRPPLSPATLEKLAQMTPLFDGKSLAGWFQAPVAPYRFAREDLVDATAFAQALASRSSPLTAWLHSQFDEPGRHALGLLRALDPTRPVTPATRDAVSAVLRNLNRLVLEPRLLFSPERFHGVTLRPETTAQRDRAASPLAQARAHRMLLEDGFPTSLARSPASGWIAKDGTLASTGASRGSIYTEQDYTHYRLTFQVRQLSGDHVPGILIFCTRPATRGDLAEAQAGIDALGAVQLQVPNGGHWDYRPGRNQAGEHFTRPVRVRFDLKEWSHVEVLVNARTGAARMAVAQPVGTRAIENLRFLDPAAGKPGPIALQLHNAGLFDEFRDLRIQLDPKEDRLLTVE